MLNLKGKPKFVLLGVIAATALITFYTFAAITGQNQPQPRQATEVESTLLPMVDYNNLKRSSTEGPVIRQARGKRYDASPMNVRELPRNIEQLPLINHFWWGLSSIPAEQSDAIIIGEVTEAQAYLSTDKTGVYSEFVITVEQTLKASESVIPASIVVERPGGAVRFPSRRIIRYEIQNQGMPRVGRRYLLFLKQNSEGDDYFVLTGYGFRKDRVVPLDNIEGLFSRHENLSESAFLNLVSTTIKGRQQ